jgi:signal transduction histidine kinase
MMQLDEMKILIIEDSLDDVELYTRTLNKIVQGHITTCSTPKQALDVIKNYPIDLILLDYNLPQMSGVDLLHELKKETVSLPCPVIALTGQGSEHVAVSFMKLGVSDYLPKSKISPETLSIAIYRALDRFNVKKMEKEKQIERIRFAHTVAHDLKAPLGRISSYVRLLSKKVPDEALHYLQNIKEDAAYMTSFLSNLLFYAEMGRSSLAKDQVDLHYAVERALSNLEIEINARKAEVHLTSLPFIEGDLISLTQLFQNLIANSLKYCEGKPLIEIDALVENDRLLVFVRDNGIGIDKKASKKAFEPFSRLDTKLNVEGVGLGLALCKTIAKQHHAKIDIEPNKSSGTTVTISFPFKKKKNNLYGLEDHRSKNVLTS